MEGKITVRLRKVNQLDRAANARPIDRGKHMVT